MSRKEKAKQRPLALNTVEMLRVASSSLGECGRCLKAPRRLLEAGTWRLDSSDCDDGCYLRGTAAVASLVQGEARCGRGTRQV